MIRYLYESIGGSVFFYELLKQKVFYSFFIMGGFILVCLIKNWRVK